MSKEKKDVNKNVEGKEIEGSVEELKGIGDDVLLQLFQSSQDLNGKQTDAIKRSINRSNEALLHLISARESAEIEETTRTLFGFKFYSRKKEWNRDVRSMEAAATVMQILHDDLTNVL